MVTTADQALIQQYTDEPVIRSAPRWAWEIIDETLALDCGSAAFDHELQQQIGAALQAMIDSSEKPDD